MNTLLRLGWLLLAYLCFAATLEHLTWMQQAEEARIILEARRVDIDRAYLKMAEFEFKVTYPPIRKRETT